MDSVSDLAKAEKLNDDEFIAMFRRVRAVLREAFPDAVDSGMGGGWADFWIKDGDVEYKLVMQSHRSLKAPQ